MKKALLVFIKNLVEGKVKTRLAATIGKVAALSVYQQLLLHTEKIARNIDVNKTVLYSNNLVTNDLWDDQVYRKTVQQGVDLGDRMFNAICNAFVEGNTQVTVIGSDCLQLESEIIEEAFKKLNEFDVVIGPADDGGYYLIAMNSPRDLLFRNVAWSTSDVLNQTILTCRELKLTVFCLPQLSDIDTELDLMKVTDKLVYKRGDD